MSMKSVQRLMLGFAISLLAVQADAQSMIDMKGTWQGTNQSIMDGFPPHVPSSVETKSAGKYRLTEQAYTFTVEGQEGRRFWGTMSSSIKTERLLGSLSVDGKRIYMIDEDGFMDGTVVNATTVEICYRHIGATAVVSCMALEKK